MFSCTACCTTSLRNHSIVEASFQIYSVKKEQKKKKKKKVIQLGTVATTFINLNLVV